MSTKKMTNEQIRKALNAMQARLELTEELLQSLKYGGKYHELTDYYTESMGTGDDFWQDRSALCEKLDEIESKVKSYEWLCYIDNTAITVGLEYHRDCCKAIIEQLESELS